MSRLPWLKWPILIIAFIFPAVVVSVPDGGSGTYVLLLLFGLFLCWPMWQELEPPERRVLLGYMVFFAIMLLSMIHTTDYANALRKVDRFFRLFAIVPVYLLVRRTGVGMGRALLYGCVLAGFSLLIEGWYEVYVLHLPYAQGIYHKIVFGDMAMLVAAVLVAAMVTLATRAWHYIVLGAATLAAMYASVLSIARSAWLLVPVGGVALLWLYRRRINRRGWLGLAAGLGMVAVLLAFWQPPIITRGIERGISDLRTYEVDPDADTSWGTRLNLWHDSLLLFAQSPILGTGIGDFDVKRNRLIAAGRANPMPSYGHAHSIYFHALATTGIVGFAAMLTALFVLPGLRFYRSWRTANEPWLRFYTLSGLLVILAFAVFGIAETWFARMPFVNMYAMFVLVFLVSIANKGDPARPSS